MADSPEKEEIRDFDWVRKRVAELIKDDSARSLWMAVNAQLSSKGEGAARNWIKSRFEESRVRADKATRRAEELLGLIDQPTAEE